jgi:peptidoglycan hydrolase-like protein with peptidoglycan-binding domain
MAPWILIGIGAGALYLIFRPKPAAGSGIPGSGYPSSPSRPVSPPPSHPTILPSAGLSTLDVQVALNYLGYSVATDGDWGPETESAVRKFQAANGLAADGVVGQQTANALSAALSAAGIENPFGHPSEEEIRNSVST